MASAPFRRFASTTAKSKAHHYFPPTEADLPRGFVLAGLHAGVKHNKPDANDLAVVLSTTPRTAAAACFTRNAFKAAPVEVSAAVLAGSAGRARALVVNSGCANAVTGARGLTDASAMARATDALLAPPPPAGGSASLVMSTGVIGQHLPIERVLAGVGAARERLAGGPAAWEAAARAFMTTDTFPKLRARRGRFGRLAGIAKGAGMIHPSMGPPHATLLGLLATDAAVAPAALQAALQHAVDRSFNSISVDGDMSTNDTIVAFASGAAAADGAPELDENSEGFAAFRDELTDFAAELAKLVVRDGEGATKFVTIDVQGALTYEDAHIVASTVSTSALVKTALFGEDAKLRYCYFHALTDGKSSWGRILAAVGRTKLSRPLDPTRVSVSFIPTDGTSPLALLVNGEPETVDEDRAKRILQEEDLMIRIELGAGGQGAQYWTCDFSYDYVTINGSYRS